MAFLGTIRRDAVSVHRFYKGTCFIRALAQFKPVAVFYTNHYQHR